MKTELLKRARLGIHVYKLDGWWILEDKIQGFSRQQLISTECILKDAVRELTLDRAKSISRKITLKSIYKTLIHNKN